jgi:hypothetical protein
MLKKSYRATSKSHSIHRSKCQTPTKTISEVNASLIGGRQFGERVWRGENKDRFESQC